PSKNIEMAVQGFGAFTALKAPFSSSSPQKRLLLGVPKLQTEHKRTFINIRSDASVSHSSNSANRASKLVTNAVAVKGETTTSPVTSKSGHELLLFEALREGLDEEMERDPRVCVVGEDVGHYGGSYKVTKGMATKYGDLRVLDTPIAENSFTGMAIGAAMTGLRPIIEGMNMGFLLLAYNQISNNCGMLHYTSGGQFTIPAVIRGPGGVGRQLGAEHSQRLESYFQSVPGLQMVACSTPYNAKGLMKAAIRSENPVILFEHVLLYNLKEKIPDEEYICCLEEAEMVRPGADVTILTYSRMRYHVMQAAKTLVNKGYDPEIIDIRSLKPFDLYTIGNSIKKTHKVLIVEECMRTGGIGASLRAAIIENFWDYLDAPIMCLSSQDVPTPYAGTLEEWTVVQPPQVVSAVEQLCHSLQWDSFNGRIFKLFNDVSRDSRLSDPIATEFAIVMLNSALSSTLQAMSNTRGYCQEADIDTYKSVGKSVPGEEIFVREVESPENDFSSALQVIIWLDGGWTGGLGGRLDEWLDELGGWTSWGWMNVGWVKGLDGLVGRVEVGWERIGRERDWTGGLDGWMLVGRDWMGGLDGLVGRVDVGWVGWMGGGWTGRVGRVMLDRLRLDGGVRREGIGRARIVLQGRSTDIPYWVVQYLLQTLAGQQFDWCSYLSNRIKSDISHARKETTEMDDEDQTHSDSGDQNITIVSLSMRGNMASGHIPLARRPPIPPTRQVQTQRRTSGKNIRFPAESAGTVHPATTKFPGLSLGGVLSVTATQLFNNIALDEEYLGFKSGDADQE
ncbi:hypothetical protein KI387_010745, partial [Taxus chinensis]